MQKFKIKLTPNEQEALLTILMNYDVSLFDDHLEKHMIVQLAGQVVKRLGNHIRDSYLQKTWTLQLNPGEAAALKLALIGITGDSYMQFLIDKILYALHGYFENLKQPGQSGELLLEQSK